MGDGLQQSTNRVVRAAMVSPFAAIPVFLIWYIIFRVFLIQPGDLAEPWPILIPLLINVLVIAVGASFLVGIPVNWLFRRLGIHSPIAYAVVGAVFGGILGLTTLSPSHFLIVMILSGVAVAVSFWALYEIRD